MRWYFVYSYFFLGLCRHPVEIKGGWSYKGDFGPRLWSRNYPLCMGTKQSPIRIVPTHAIHNPFLEKLAVKRYNSTSGYVLSMFNNGKSVQVRLSGGPYVEGAGSAGPYIIAQFHFHWGKTDESGSEHVINNKRYPMELHLVHYAKKYRSLESAMTKSDGLAVIGIFFEVVEKDNPNLDAIVSKLHHIPAKGQSVLIKKFNLMSVLPDDWKKYYRYHGSLTTPPCYESVTWTVFHSPINISARQLGEFRKIYKTSSQSAQISFESTDQRDRAESFAIVDNYRPLQRLNGRIVYSSFFPPNPLSSASSTATGTILTCFLMELLKMCALSWALYK